jgi:hypothetical protein
VSFNHYYFNIDSVDRDGAVARVRGGELLSSGTEINRFDLLLLPRAQIVRDAKLGCDLPWNGERINALISAAFDWLLWNKC